MRKIVLGTTIAALGAFAVAATVALASHGRGGFEQAFGGSSRSAFFARLSGYEEMLSPTMGAVSTTGRGRFTARLTEGRLAYTLSYSQLEGAVTQAHIHFGQRHTIGGVSAFLCDQAANDIPNCPASGTVEGVVEPSDVIGPEAQGIEPGRFEELVAAMRHHATYVNVHTNKFPPGEIRGQVR